MRRQLPLIIIVIFCTCQLYAQNKTWTLHDCILYAVEHSPRIKNENSRNNIYHQDYLEAIGKLLPHISANTSAGFNFGRGVDEETNTYINVNSFSNNYNLSVSMTLFDGLANYRRVKIGKMNKVKGKKELEDAKDMLAYETMETFYNVLYNQDVVKIAEEQLSQSSQNLKQIKKMEEVGLKGLPDVAEADAKFAEDTYNLTKQNNLLTISIIQLKEKMNFPIEEELEVAEDDYSSLIVKVTDTPLDIYHKSVEINPKAQIAKSDLYIENQNYKASKGSLLPTLSVGGGVSTNFFRNIDGSDYASFSSQFKNKRGEYLAFTLSVPLFDGFSRTASVKRAKAQLYIAQNERDDVFRKLYSDIEQAVADANGQVDEYYQAVKQREAAEVAYEVNQRKYEEGLLDPILLYTSANRLQKTKTEEYRSKYLYNLKYKLVNYYKGEPLF